jgi:hypothetical protein
VRPDSLSKRSTHCTKKRKALNHGNKTPRTTSFTPVQTINTNSQTATNESNSLINKQRVPSSWNLRGSARTTGELMRYNRRASAPHLSTKPDGSG